jgi:dGTP triphosphohydrolase
LVQSFKAQNRRTFECEIMNWSDDVAYSSHDLEDALVIGTVRYEDLVSSETRSRILAWATKSYGADYPELERDRRLRDQDVDEALEGVIKYCMDQKGDRLARIKTFIAAHINDCVTTASVETHESQLRRYRYRLKLDPTMVRRVEIYKQITFACVIQTNAVLTLQQAGRRVVCDLYRSYSDADFDQVRYLYPVDWLDRVDEALAKTKSGQEPAALKRLSRDYIASMTDRFAEEQWRRLNLPGEGRLFGPRA